MLSDLRYIKSLANMYDLLMGLCGNVLLTYIQ